MISLHLLIYCLWLSFDTFSLIILGLFFESLAFECVSFLVNWIVKWLKSGVGVSHFLFFCVFFTVYSWHCFSVNSFIWLTLKTYRSCFIVWTMKGVLWNYFCVFKKFSQTIIKINKKNFPLISNSILLLLAHNNWQWGVREICVQVAQEV